MPEGYLRGTEVCVLMLSLLRFRDVADSAAHPEMAPAAPISGAEAVDRYIGHTLPLLRAGGGDLLFLTAGDPLPVGPEDERWNMAMLIYARLSQPLPRRGR